MAPGPYTEAAMRNAGLDLLDDRGLMPLADAVARVAATGIYTQGKGRLIRGIYVTDGYLLWAALLSLEGPEDFVREARRLKWKHNPPMMDNRAPVERYGIGILPWLADHVDRRGTLLNHPWCILPCLLALPDPAVGALLASVKEVRGYDEDEPADRKAQARDLERRWHEAWGR